MKLFDTNLAKGGSMTISIRTKNGWKEVENKDREYCDKCEKRLWIAPHGGLYCNEHKHD